MELINKETEKTIRQYPIGSQEMEEDPVCFLKFFTPFGRATWYVIEGKQEEDGDYLFFGYVESPIDPLFNELGYFTLNELKSIRGPLGLGVERDLYYEPTRLTEIQEMMGIHE